MGPSAEGTLSPYHPRYWKDSHGSGGAAARSRMTREQQFLSELAVIERVIAWVCARRGLRGADADDFASVVKTRLVENDYEILAKFQGRSSLKTYLTAVINRLYLDFQVQRFGKWRSSAEARRLGTVALRLECLMFRDGLSFDEACGVLQSDPRVTETRDALHALLLRLPNRPGRVPRGDGHEPVRLESAASAVERAERQALAERTFAVIRRSLSRLPAPDRVFMRLHLESGLTVAEASRSLGLDQKSLYRKKDDVLKRLRSALEAEGIGSEAARELLSSLDWDAAFGLQDVVQGSEQAGSRPSQGHGAAAHGEGEP
jgi:RNA polymerase sigma factor (sigma-70 family)